MTTPNATSPAPLPDGLSAELLPRHIAIIMDGNGRWAKAQNKPRMFGHERGALTTQRIVAESARLGIGYLTLYSFSIENWKRPPEEVDFLMELCRQRLEAELPMMMDNNVRFVHVGRREGLSQAVLDDLDRTIELTSKNTGLTLALAWNYGSRAEITAGIRRIAEQVKAGELAVDDITDQTLSDHLLTAGLPDPDLLIRTAGEMRLSNFLLWQISYAELWVTDVLWPQFTAEHLHGALRDYAGRHRRYGGL
ncbi:isoprenyl transferase [Planctomycetales bacterium ZRK34]|nr:isoprenyl transferase [Planctomycetales bacterium ZRK34]